MKNYQVVFRPRAEADLLALYRHIAGNSGRVVAGAYIDRIEAACLALEIFPERGARRDDIRQGLRTVGFERRATIVFQVLKTEVVVVRILFGGRDFARAMRGTNDD
ncbi:MAG: type II toxin-antitoxin system RelE/ParE family toxin [Alphaproteobacteria bacterium]|nr:type II toxin-antitoxin system RelE/ParE family toxin [Alphaproteobacteria bacterium]MBM3949931.1 type II toxin-antitoxin system RelE/ParE family toxin [Rhodospirillales bacterium]